MDGNTLTTPETKLPKLATSNQGALSYECLMSEKALLNLQPCCRQTVKSHVAHNPMMVCPECKIMIKCFSDEKAFNNYVTFCRSRGRRIKTASDMGFYFVMYNTYPMSIGSGG